jgi:hypothetical protein
MTIEKQLENELKMPQIIFPVIQPNINIEALTGESEKLIGILGRKALVTLVTCEASKLRRIASKRDNDVSQERSD